MKRALLFIICGCFQSILSAAAVDTLRLCLDDCMTIARRQSVEAAVDLGELKSAYWAWRSYKADFNLFVSLE